MDTLVFMEYFTLAVTLLMFSTGIAPCANMYKTGSTRNVPYVVFLLSTISCGGMCHYGLMLGVNTLVFLNAVGLILNGIYSLLFISVSKSKSQPLSYLILAVLYVAGLYNYIYTMVDSPGERADTLGKSSSIITTILVSVLPLIEVVGNIRYKNADGMPLIMLIGGLACSISWLVYGLMLNDPNIYFPNIPGLTVTAIKLSVIAIYSGSDEKLKTS